jgi:hypothetical protein
MFNMELLLKMVIIHVHELVEPIDDTYAQGCRGD